MANSFLVPVGLPAGDVIKIEVANPQKQGLLNPANPDFLGAPVAKCFSSVINDPARQ
jgi:hypothetical protein